MMEPICLLLTTVDDTANAEKIAEALISKRLAACVQLSSPITSYYHWQKKLERSVEYRLQIKLLPSQCDAAIAWLLAHHPYQTPELVKLEGASTEAYTQWMQLEQVPIQG